eukprot:TRINITY_DN3439_c0_g1_i1.p1 TRINITY_DN3439_c0_g1~~TRINITY_DN3439_c0_g1_i1.p1  ORF type:complete len:189 (+),score=52.11 TRINITY_DN3439_c0_g1_i1:192-758(+)
MSDQIEKYENVSDDDFVSHRFPKGDIFYNYEPDDSPEKFDYLKAKYLFRFPFTVTALKWGFALGCFFGLHTYIKTRRVSNAGYWFVWGFFLTGMPIWAFFMFKYSFYSVAIRKFEKEQFQQNEGALVMREYIKKKLDVREPEIEDEELVQRMQQRQKELYEKYKILDEIEIEDIEAELEAMEQAKKTQ